MNEIRAVKIDFLGSLRASNWLFKVVSVVWQLTILYILDEDEDEDDRVKHSFLI